jgi:hypothetical protein
MSELTSEQMFQFDALWKKISDLEQQVIELQPDPYEDQENAINCPFDDGDDNWIDQDDTEGFEDFEQVQCWGCGTILPTYDLLDCQGHPQCPACGSTGYDQFMTQDDQW